MHDILIIGGGPAGMTAALYALRAGKSVLLLEKNAFGGQIAYSPKVENFPGTDSMSAAISLTASLAGNQTLRGVRYRGRHQR